MRLLVSVTDAREARAAAAGGADVIDAKDPLRGALGAVTPQVFAEIRRAVTRPLSAALGDAADEVQAAADALAFHRAGAAFVKLGFGRASSARTVSLLAAAVRGAPAAVVAVAYADADGAGGASADAVLEAAAYAGAAGVLLDTADKQGPAVRELFSDARLAAWIRAVHGAGLLVAVAGRLRAADLGAVRDAGADIAGVRGAACVGGRAGIVSARKVRVLRELCA